VTSGRFGGAKGQRWGFDAAVGSEADRPVLRLRGRIGYADLPALDAALAEVSGAGVDTVIDLAAVDYLSGGAAARLEAFAAGLAARGGRLRLRGLQQPVRQVLDFAGVLSPAVLDEDAPGPAGDPSAG
jgi:anti-anti-sigma regulatory factor